MSQEYLSALARQLTSSASKGKPRLLTSSKKLSGGIKMATSPNDPTQSQFLSTTPRRIKVVVATTVMLSFISFWRAAAIVLNDLGSSAFYVGGIAEQAVGPAAPWFILGVMLFSYAVRSVYVESCAMFTRGGVYRVVKEAMGGTLAKLSVSALMFDYILTGPISGVSAGQYIVGLIAQTLTYFGYAWQPDKDTINLISAGIAIVITLYFWWRNTRGIHESSDDALKIMYIVTAMIAVMILWCAATLVMRPETRRLPPKPSPYSLVFNKDSVGWMPKLAPGKVIALPVESKTAPQEEPNYGIPSQSGTLFGLIGILIALGHSFLAMSGEESLAQVNRELEFPKHKNLMKAGLVIFLYSLLFTSLVSFFAYAIIPDSVRSQYYDNLISGIALNLVGPTPLKLAFQGFIVIVGFLMLAGAVNTAIIGSNGVLNRVSEDGVLTDWFRHPHRKYGTTHRIIDMVVLLQLLTIIVSRGNVYTLGEAYAFGVIWSFAFKGLAVLVLRFKDKSSREWKVPFNLRVGNTELPLGLGVISLILFSIAGINLITKQVATVSGLIFTLVFFVLFWVSEHRNIKKRGAATHVEMDQFKIIPKDEIAADTRYIRAGNALCLVRDYNTLEHVRFALEKVDTEKKDLVILTIRKLTGPDTGYEHLDQSELFTSYEQLLFSKVVSLAEKAGKHVELMVVPSSQVFQAIALVATQLKSSEIIAGRSSIMEPETQAAQLGQAWEQLPEKPPYPVPFHVIGAHGKTQTFYLGAHAPDLAVEDVELIHRLWLDLSQQPGHEKIHHRDVVTYALIHLQRDLSGPHQQAIIKQLGKASPGH
jgi:amino acid transporter